MEPKRYEATSIEGETRTANHDALAPEAPLHITVNGEAYVTTMRTPDRFDEELARGLLFTEGIVSNREALIESSAMVDPESGEVARLSLVIDEHDLAKPVAGRRNQMATSSCGICGTREPADLEIYGDPLMITDEGIVDPKSIGVMMSDMSANQTLFQLTGGTHGASAFSLDGTLLAIREDVGRHNAVDKVIGHLLLNGTLSDAAVLTVSSRISYEIVTKAFRAGIPILAAISAPTTMAVDTAQAFGITLIGFCREDRMSVYAHPQRIEEAS
jgi:FdhD protein